MTRETESASSSLLLDGVMGLMSRQTLTPKRARESYLRLLLSTTGADVAWLIPTRKGRLQSEAALRVGDSPRQLPLEKAEKCLRQAEAVSVDHQESPAESIWRIQLRFDGRPQCVILLGGGDHDPFLESDLVTALPLLAFLEHSIALRGLLQGSRVELEELTRKSRQLAERNRRLFEELATHRERLESVSKGVIRMQEEERSKISRELHDGVGQALTALKINLDLLGVEVDDHLGPDSKQRFETTRGLAAECLKEIRELSRLLRPRMLDDLGLSATLRWLVRSFEERTGLKVELDDRTENRRFGADIETLVFRITQEALNNVVKHADAETARVGLRQSGGWMNLEITDPGRGFDPEGIEAGASRGSGLRGMQDRVSLAGGTFTLTSAPGEGTRLTVRVPPAADERGGQV